MKLISWNVNGLRACLKKGFEEFFYLSGADVFCVQETKMQPGQAEINFPGYTQFWNSAIKKGYSGTAVFTRVEPLNVAYNLDSPGHDTEGRSITVEFDNFYLINVYVPNSQSELARIGYRIEWEDAFRQYVGKLDQKKPVIVCGDLNVAHQPIDLKNPVPNEGSPGYSIQEREKFDMLLDAGFTDAFRYLYPEKEGAYTWWSYQFRARQTNAGWRIDYFLVSSKIAGEIKECDIYSDIYGSDHCPIGLEIF